MPSPFWTIFTVANLIALTNGYGIARRAEWQRSTDWNLFFHFGLILCGILFGIETQWPWGVILVIGTYFITGNLGYLAGKPQTNSKYTELQQLSESRLQEYLQAIMANDLDAMREIELDLPIEKRLSVRAAADDMAFWYLHYTQSMVTLYIEALVRNDFDTVNQIESTLPSEHRIAFRENTLAWIRLQALLS